MRVGILGSGLMGGKLGTIFARAGHEVVFSYARSMEKLKKLARDAHGNAWAGTPVYGGPLRIARHTEPFSLLIGELAYGGKNGPELAYRFEWFGK